MFTGLDPLEDGNRYAWVQGNVINRIDLAGLFSCAAEQGIGVSASCDDLDQALNRASLRGYNFGNIRQATENGFLQVRELELAAESNFGIRLEFYPSKEANPEPNCNSATGDTLDYVKRTLVRSVAAFVHVVSRFDEAGYKNSLFLFNKNVGGNGRLRINLNANDKTDGSGFGSTPHGTGNEVYLGSNVITSTIVHELGHAIDRNFQYKVSSPLIGLYLLRDTGEPTYDSEAEGFPNTTQNGNGLSGRAAQFQSTNQEEIWPDMFMSWVFGEYNTQTDRQIRNYDNDIVGWNLQKPRDANFKFAYADFVIQCLMSGNCSGVNFPSGLPPVGETPPDNPFWLLVRRVAQNVREGKRIT